MALQTTQEWLAGNWDTVRIVRTDHHSPHPLSSGCICIYTGATFLFNRGGVGGIPRTGNGLRQGMCSGSELRLIDCPDLGDYGMCGQLDDNDIVRLTCRRGKYRTF